MSAESSFDIGEIIVRIVGYPENLTPAQRSSYARSIREHVLSLRGNGDNEVERHISGILDAHYSKAIYDHIRRSRNAILVNRETNETVSTTKFIGVRMFDDEGARSRMVQQTLWQESSVGQFIRSLEEEREKHASADKRLVIREQVAKIALSACSSKEQSMKDALEAAGYDWRAFDLGDEEGIV